MRAVLGALAFVAVTYLPVLVVIVFAAIAVGAVVYERGREIDEECQ